MPFRCARGAYTCNDEPRLNEDAVPAGDGQRRLDGGADQDARRMGRASRRTRPFKLGFRNTLGADPARQARIDDGSHEIGCEEGEGDGAGDVALGAALADSDVIRRRSAEDLIQPFAGERDRLQQDRSGFGFDAALVALDSTRPEDLAPAHSGAW